MDKLFKQVINKWYGIAYRGRIDKQSDNCAFCKKFNLCNDCHNEYMLEWECDGCYKNNNECIGCPVRSKTGKSFCEGTPYERWSDVALDHKEETWLLVGSPESKQAAIAILNFLRELYTEWRKNNP